MRFSPIHLRPTYTVPSYPPSAAQKGIPRRLKNLYDRVIAHLRADLANYKRYRVRERREFPEEDGRRWEFVRIRSEEEENEDRSARN